MRVLFLPSGDRQWAGARFRAWNIAAAWPEADCVRWAGTPPANILEHDAIILQKLYDRYNLGNQMAVLNLAGQLRLAGKKVIWDLCDPIWWWNEPEWIKEMATFCNAITVSCEGLAEDFHRSFGLTPTVIPDRMPFVQEWKTSWEAKEPKLVWFGYSMNRGPSLGGIGLILSRLMYERIPFRLRIIDDHPEIEPWQLDRLWSDKIECTKWEEASIHERLMECDIALLPPMPGPWAKMKSTNKQITAFWAGLPVHDGEDYYSLRDLLRHPTKRQAEGGKNRAVAEGSYDLRLSVKQWQELLITL